MAVTGAGDQSEEASPQQEIKGEAEAKSSVKTSGQFVIRDELLNRIHKCLGLLNTSLQHLQLEGLINYMYQELAFVMVILFIQSKASLLVADEILLHMPDIDQHLEVHELLLDPEVVEKLEQCVMNWQTQITIVIEEQKSKKPQVCDFSCILGAGSITGEVLFLLGSLSYNQKAFTGLVVMHRVD